MLAQVGWRAMGLTAFEAPKSGSSKSVQQRSQTSRSRS
jgi:hypothetical protein